MDKRDFRAINNRLIEREMGEMAVECLNTGATTMMDFVEEKDHEALGLHSLKALGIEVDPATRRLKEAETCRHLTYLRESRKPTLLYYSSEPYRCDNY